MTKRKARICATAKATRVVQAYLYIVHLGRCYYCSHHVSLEVNGPKALSVGHRIPISGGGADSLDNLVLCCYSCNCGKQNRSEKEFIDWKATNSVRRPQNISTTKAISERIAAERAAKIQEVLSSMMFLCLMKAIAR